MVIHHLAQVMRFPTNNQIRQLDVGSSQKSPAEAETEREDRSVSGSEPRTKKSKETTKIKKKNNFYKGKKKKKRITAKRYQVM